MKIEKGKRVKLDYELKNENGDLIESSKEKGPLEYVHGSGQIPLPDLENQLLGLEKGATKEGKLPIPIENAPKEEYKKSVFPADQPLTVGTYFEAKRPDGSPVLLKVVAAEDENVTVELLPFLFYKVTVLDVTDA